MKRLTVASAFMLALSILVNIAGISLRPAGAVVPSKPYTFVANTLAQSSQVNADFDTLYSVLNGNLDHTNLNGTGIYASQVVADTTLHATFGGSQVYTFPAGLVVNGTPINPQRATLLFTLISNCAPGTQCSGSLSGGTLSFSPTYASAPACFANMAFVSGDFLTPVQVTPINVTTSSLGLNVFNVSSSTISAGGTTHVQWVCL